MNKVNYEKKKTLARSKTKESVSANQMKQKKKPNAAGKSDLVDVKARLNLIINKDRSPKETKSKKVVQHHHLDCFKPREIFNINTHALFQKAKVKDPLDSDAESNDDDNEIQKLLME